MQEPAHWDETLIRHHRANQRRVKTDARILTRQGHIDPCVSHQRRKLFQKSPGSRHRFNPTKEQRCRGATGGRIEAGGPSVPIPSTGDRNGWCSRERAGQRARLVSARHSRFRGRQQAPFHATWSSSCCRFCRRFFDWHFSQYTQCAGLPGRFPSQRNHLRIVRVRGFATAGLGSRQRRARDRG